MDSRKFGSAVLALVGVADEHLDAVIRALNALNKQRSGRAFAMARLLVEALDELDADIKSPKQITHSIQPEPRTISVLPDLTFAERVTAGKYVCNKSDPVIISSLFIHDQATVGVWEYDLYWSTYCTFLDTSKTEFEVDGWVAAKWEHVLAYGAAFPDDRRRYHILAIGSTCSTVGGCCLLGIWYDSDSSRRGLNLFPADSGWGARFCFLRVRKVGAQVA